MREQISGKRVPQAAVSPISAAELPSQVRLREIKTRTPT